MLELKTEFLLPTLSSTYLADVSPLVKENLGHNFAGKHTKQQVRLVTKKQKRKNLEGKSQLEDGFGGKISRSLGNKGKNPLPAS